MNDTRGIIAQLVGVLNDAQAAAKTETDGKLDAFERLMSEVSNSLADIAAALDSADGTQALADAVRSIKLKVDAPAVTVSPQITVSPTPVTVQNQVDVQPTPITVEAVLPPVPAPIVHFTQRDPVAYEVRIAGQYGAPDRVMTITPITRKT